MNYRCIFIAAVFAVFLSANRFSAAEKSEKTNTEQRIERSSENDKNKQKPEALFKRLDVRTSSSFRFDAADSSAQASALTAAGMRALFRDADVRFYEVLSDIALPHFKSAAVHSPQYGAAVSFARALRFPLMLKAGTLSVNGSFLRLTSPAPPFSASPFATSFPTKTGIASSLPSSGTGNKTFAVAADCRIPNTAPLFAGSGASFFYREDGTLASSADIRIALPRMISAGISFTGTSVFLKNNASSWFSEISFFKPARYSAFALQTLFSAPNITSLFTAGFYNQPSGKLRRTYRSENVFAFGSCTLLASVFAADGRGIMTPSGEVLHTLRQFRISPQYTHRFPSPRLPSFTVGAAGVMRQTYTPARDIEQIEVKCGGGLRYADKYISASLTFESAGIEFSNAQKLDADTLYYTISGRFARRSGNLRWGTQASCTFSKKTAEESCKISIAHSKKNFTVSGNAGFSLKQKNDEYGGGSAALGFSASYTTKFIKYTFRLSAAGKY